MSEAPLLIPEFEAALRSDYDGSKLQGWLDQCSAGLRQVERMLDEGVSRDQAARLITFKSAYHEGMELLPKVRASLAADS